MNESAKHRNEGLRHRDAKRWNRSKAYREGYHDGRMDEREDKMARPVLIQFVMEDGRVANLKEPVRKLAEVGLKLVPIEHGGLKPESTGVPTTEPSCRISTTYAAS